MINYKVASKEQLNDEFKRLSKAVSDLPFGTKKEFFHLPKILHDGEEPLAVASGIMDGNTWLITLTNQRIIFLDKGMIFGLKQVAINLANIVSVGGKTGILMGKISVGTSGQNYTISNVAKGCVVPFTNLVNSARDALTHPAPESKTAKAPAQENDVIAQLEKLASLKERGILSDEEFMVQKSKVLGA
ncbi:Uncharacterised protein [Yersinia enterocolitica]|jgi:Bacterial PH domain/Short C-terminal domain|uniref:PH domain-containing protein n=1 Tax=Yersinia intermedia TaxID=631 RepID=UPI0005DF23AB|nr:PH domain-containing protein [Yersinia intermedia]CNK63005.1 Uncharacterised protein [Yersinia enterocolitica]CQJ58103.1 Uncharacterised protein [Yersinia intermedia]